MERVKAVKISINVEFICSKYVKGEKLRDEQALNAEHLVACGAAKMIEQPQLTVDGLAQQINLLNRIALEHMACAARNAAIIDADQRVADVIKSLAKN